MNLKIGIVRGIALEGTQKGMQVVRLEGHYLQLGEYGQVENVGVATPVEGQVLQSSETVDGGDQLTALLPFNPVHHEVGQLALPLGMLKKGDQALIVVCDVL